MRKQSICGYMAKSVDNSSGTVFTSLTTICSLIQKIVTKTEILVLVSLLLDTNFKRYRPILGDISNLWIIRRGRFLLIWLQSTILEQQL